jgi:hypothetical protein
MRSSWPPVTGFSRPQALLDAVGEARADLVERDGDAVLGARDLRATSLTGRFFQ